MAGYGRRADSGWDVAMQGMNFMNNAMSTGQAIGEQRYQTAERDGVNKAYDYIVGKLGNDGDMSMLSGDPILNTRHGAMGAGLFEQQRLSNQTARLGFLQKRAAADTELYENTIRPMMGAATEAYKSGDMQRFGLIAGELSKKFPFPYRYTLGEDGMFKEEFRSDKHEGWVDTNGRITPQQAYAQLEGLMRGEQKILVGANMQTKYVNPDFLAMSSRYAMGTAMKNAQNLADPKSHIPLTKNGKTVYAVIQNRHDDYSAEPSFYVMDESGQYTGYYTGKQLIEMGFARADVEADIQNKQRIAAGKSAGGGSTGEATSGNMPYKVSEGDMAWIGKTATVSDGMGGESYNPYMAICLELLMKKNGLGRNAAYIALDASLKKMTNTAMKANPKATPEQVQQAAYMKLASTLSGNGQQAATPTATPLANPTASAAPQTPFQSNLATIATGTGAPKQQATPQEEHYSPAEGHQNMVNGLVGGMQAAPGIVKDGLNWWRDSMKNNAE